MLFEIKEDCNIVTVFYEERGRKKEKDININDFIESMISAKNKKVDPVTSHLYMEYDGVKIIQSKFINKTTQIYFLHREKRQAPGQIFNRSYGDIGYPGMIFAIRVVNKIISSVYVVAVKDTNVSEKTELFCYPYSNVDNKSGKACIGSNGMNLGKVDNQRVLHVPNMFFSMPNTLHIFSNENNKLHYECEELMKFMQRKDFDDSILVPLCKYKTYKEWVKSIN